MSTKTKTKIKKVEDEDTNLKEGNKEDKDEPDVDHLDVGGLGEVLGHRDEHRDQHQHHCQVHHHCGFLICVT